MSREYTLLREEECFGGDGEETIEVIKKRGTKAAITDYAIINGGFYSDFTRVDSNNELDGRTGWYWTRSASRDDSVGVASAHSVTDRGLDYSDIFTTKSNGIRPVSKFESINRIPCNGARKSALRREKDGVEYVLYGSYPQHAASAELQDQLETKYNLYKEGIYDWDFFNTGYRYMTTSLEFNKERRL